MTNENDIHADFRHYRNSGIAISVTLISLSSALIIWGKNIIELEKPSSPIQSESSGESPKMSPTGSIKP